MSFGEFVADQNDFQVNTMYYRCVGIKCVIRIRLNINHAALDERFEAATVVSRTILVRFESRTAGRCRKSHPGRTHIPEMPHCRYPRNHKT